MVPKAQRDELRAEGAGLIGELRREPCFVCGKAPAGSVHHVIPLKFGGTNDHENLMPVHMQKVNGCSGHWAANAACDAWVRRNVHLYEVCTVKEMAERCKAEVLPLLREKGAGG